MVDGGVDVDKIVFMVYNVLRVFILGNPVF